MTLVWRRGNYSAKLKGPAYDQRTSDHARFRGLVVRIIGPKQLRRACERAGGEYAYAVSIIMYIPAYFFFCASCSHACQP